MKSLLSRIGTEISRLWPFRADGQQETVSGGLGDLLGSIREKEGRIPLSWVRSTTTVPYSNLGDQLSSIIVSAITRRPATHVDFDSSLTRLLAIGTIGQQQRAGTIHIWGSGFENLSRKAGGIVEPFLGFPEVTYRVHALRGPFSARLLKDIGLPSSEVYGDPAWFLPKIFQDRPQKKYELGVIPHLAELEERTPAPVPKATLRRYAGGDADGIKLISTYHEPSWDGFRLKIEEILSCRRIISRSLHGLIIADAFRIPCLYVSPIDEGHQRLSIDTDARILDRRFADAYAGFGSSDILSFGMPMESSTNWARVIRAIDDFWEPTSFTGAELFHSFPLPKAVTFDQQDWSLPEALVSSLEW
jgi:pyruvyltransferase